jgi:hypothetical protein
VVGVFNLGKTQQQWTPIIESAAIPRESLFEFGGARLDEPLMLPPLAGYIKGDIKPIYLFCLLFPSILIGRQNRNKNHGIY